ncbi:hypothetical protein SAMN04487950_1366 [Halogranum rubrum]|uniref:Uncharacterized protein n=1 Tax=Halogranum rubrum TaxID=553466 RepID=A0A1I4CRN3_9EURY|nr:hypothetical protein [Halogranum rubrum]SFK83922.1 hypothetical protein SAMN04487950_1366 [Halogranum rubrum]
MEKVDAHEVAASTGLFLDEYGEQVSVERLRADGIVVDADEPDLQPVNRS